MALFSSFAVAAHDLDFIRLNRDRVLHLKRHVFDQKSPDFVTEAVCVEVALKYNSRVSPLPRADRIRLFLEHVREVP